MPLARKLLIGWIVVFTGLTAFGLSQNRGLINENGDRIRDQEQAQRVFCGIEVGREQRQLVSTRRYLDAHPRGAPGIPARLIHASIEDHKGTLLDLRAAGCDIDEQLLKEAP